MSSIESFPPPQTNLPSSNEREVSGGNISPNETVSDPVVLQTLAVASSEDPSLSSVTLSPVLIHEQARAPSPAKPRQELSDRQKNGEVLSASTPDFCGTIDRPLAGEGNMSKVIGETQQEDILALMDHGENNTQTVPVTLMNLETPQPSPLSASERSSSHEEIIRPIEEPIQNEAKEERSIRGNEQDSLDFVRGEAELGGESTPATDLETEDFSPNGSLAEYTSPPTSLPTPTPSSPEVPALRTSTAEDISEQERKEELERKGLEDRLQRTSDFRLLKERSLRELQRFLEVLEQARGSKVLITIKGHPDPDSIASALAQQYFCSQFEIKTSILYFDEISHPENRALVKALELGMKSYDPEAPIDLSTFDYLCFVDTQSPKLPEEVGVRNSEIPPTLTLIDHHKEIEGIEANFIDVREGIGSTSSIYSEYLEFAANEIGLNRNDASHALLATALMHGIRTDTDNLMIASPSDFYAAAYLRNFIDRDLLRMISQQSVSARTMEIIQRGLNNKVIKGTFLLAGVEFVREEDRDGIAQTADFLMRHEGVETAVVFGIVNNTIVDGSLRTSSATVDPDRWIKDTFGSNPQGSYYGGGRRNKGAFQIPLGLLSSCPDKRALWKLGERTVRNLIFQKIGEEEDVTEEEGKE